MASLTGLKLLSPVIDGLISSIVVLVM